MSNFEEGGISIGVAQTSENIMSVEIVTPHGRVYVTADIAEALAIDLMECAGLLDAYAEGGIDAMRQAVQESELDLTAINPESAELLGLPIPDGEPVYPDAKEYDDAEEFLSDMEHQQPQVKKTLH